MPRPIAALAVTLVAFPATAFAMPADPHYRHPGGRLHAGQDGSGVIKANPYSGMPRDWWIPELPTAPSHQVVLIRGTDAAAPDQQAPVSTSSSVSERASSGFDWADAGAGAGGAIALLGLSLGAGMTLRRRHTVAG